MTNDGDDTAGVSDFTFIDLRWRKSTFSTAGECVGLKDMTGYVRIRIGRRTMVLPATWVTSLDGYVGMRNLRDKQGPIVFVHRSAFGPWLEGVKGGEFDDLVDSPLG